MTTKSAMFARGLSRNIAANSKTAAAIMLMIQNNLDPEVAQCPQELITYGGNGGSIPGLGTVPDADNADSSFSKMTEDQTSSHVFWPSIRPVPIRLQ